MKHFVSVKDVTDISALVQLAGDYKKEPLKNQSLGRGKRIGMLFLNPSLRTRLSTQIAAGNLGMEAIVFNMGNEGWDIELEDGAIMNGNTVEHIKDAAPLLGAYFDVLCVRTFPGLQNRDEDYQESMINALIRYAGVPVVSMESTTLHPLQSLADIITIQETWKQTRKPKIVLSWAPHIKPLPQCVPNSFSQWMNAWGAADFTIAHPPGYELSAEFTENVTIAYDQQKAIEGADYIYFKNWSSYHDYGKMPAVSGSWLLAPEDLSKTNNARIMHCLPVRRNVELRDELLDGPDSMVTQQGSNRVWAAQAVLSEILRTIG